MCRFCNLITRKYVVWYLLSSIRFKIKIKINVTFAKPTYEFIRGTLCYSCVAPLYKSPNWDHLALKTIAHNSINCWNTRVLELRLEAQPNHTSLASYTNKVNYIDISRQYDNSHFQKSHKVIIYVPQCSTGARPPDALFGWPQTIGAQYKNIINLK